MKPHFTRRTNIVAFGLLASNGDTRIVDSGKPCRTYETPIAWNQKGQNGAGWRP